MDQQSTLGVQIYLRDGYPSESSIMKKAVGKTAFPMETSGDSDFSFPTAADLSNEDLPDPTNGNTTLVAAPTSVVADGSTTSSVTVTLEQMLGGNLLTASGGTVALSSTGSATIGAVTDNGDGTYTATVTNTVAESVTISGTLDGVSITDTSTVTLQLAQLIQPMETLHWLQHQQVLSLMDLQPQA